MKLILASGSEWRKKLLEWLEVQLETIESGIAETAFNDEEPSELVARLATTKAEKVADRITDDMMEKHLDSDEGTVVIGADTVIAVDGHIIGKPKDKHDAEVIIQMLSGKEHEVWTGVAVVDPITGDRKVETVVTRVRFRDIGAEELAIYLETKEWEGKAGAYQVQGMVKKFITSIDGSYTNVIGLPLIVLGEFLEDMGVVIDVDIPEVIKEKTGYLS
jgi:septum formation protein